MWSTITPFIVFDISQVLGEKMTTKMFENGHFATIFMILEENLHDYEQQTTFYDIIVNIL